MAISDNTTIATLRLRNHSLLSGKLPSPVEAVRAMGALQGQDLPGVKWSIAQRCAATLAEVNGAFDSGAIVRSWPFRGTLHVVAAEDLVWMLDLTAERTLTGLAGRHRQLGLDPQTFATAAESAVRALAGGRGLSRENFFAALNADGIATDGQRGAHILLTLCHQKLLCLGPTEGTGQAVVLLDEWITHHARPDREHAVAVLAERFFRSHGPATLADFVWWSKLKIVDARAGLAAASGLQRLRTRDDDYWLGDDVDALVPVLVAPRVALLPGFDEYLLGYRDRSAVLPAEHSEKIVPGGNGMFLPTIVSRGTVIGTWRKRTSGRDVTISPAPFAHLNATDIRGIARAAQDYANYLGLSLGPIE